MVLSDLSNHPNLPEFHGIFLKKGKTAEEDQLWFVMELMHGGSITDLGNKSDFHLLTTLFAVISLVKIDNSHVLYLVCFTVHELKQNNSRLNDNQIAFVLRETLKALGKRFGSVALRQSR